MNLRFDIKLPTLNEYIAAERSTNKRAGSALKKKWTNIVEVIVLSQTKEKLSGLYDVEIDWITKDNRKDADNVYFAVKFILDGLVKSKLLPNDGRANIRDIKNTISTEKKDYCIVRFLAV
jgi:hypothetical protein